MAIVKKEMNYAQETADVLKFVVELIKTIKEGGDYTSLVDELVKAVGGLDQIDDEFKGDMEAFANTCFVELSKIIWIFTNKK